MFKKKLKEVAERMKYLWTAQGLPKNILLKAELQCMLSVRKNLRNNKKKQAWWSSELKIWEVKEFIRIENASFKKQKLYPNEENKKAHKLWQIKCKNIIRQAKKKSLRNSWLEQSKVILNSSSST